jgi:hypothetical protein
MDRLRFAVVTTHDRPRDYADCIESLIPQADFVSTVSHGNPDYVWDIWRDLGPHRVSCSIIPYEAEIPNISAMWNIGIEQMRWVAAGEPYDVAILNDDVVLPFDWFDRVTTAMRQTGAAAGAVRRKNNPRMAGYAFILDGCSGLQADEQFQWWYGDDDLELRAKYAGGVALTDGPDVEHRYPNSTTVGVLAEIAKEDKKRFTRKWGHRAS